MSKLFYMALGALTAWAATNFAERWKAGPMLGLAPANVEPGPWYAYYVGDYMAHFGVKSTEVKSVAARMGGDWVWLTDTPEWDRAWFRDNLGWEFPAKWELYSRDPWI